MAFTFSSTHSFRHLLPNWFVWLLFLSSLAAAIFYLIDRQVDRIIAEESRTLNHRVELIDNYIKSCKRVVDAMSNTVKASYINAAETTLPPAVFDYLHDYPKYNTFAISGFDQDGGNDQFYSTLTGQGSLNRIDIDLQREILAALALDSQIGTQTTDNSDFIWAYYTSKRNFAILAPKVPVDDFQFSTDLYQKEYWTLAEPSVNADLKTVVTPLYEDAGGQGLMITVSSPVTANKKFLGITSVDIGLKTLSHLLSIEKGFGESVLVGHQGNIIAKDNNTKLGEQLDFDLQLHLDTVSKVNDSWWIFQPLSSSEIIVANRLNIWDTYILAVKQSSMVSLLLILMSALLVMMLKLKQTLVKITSLAHVDQLSSLLNRRGFRDSIDQIFLLNERINAPWVILMLDIDLFKRVNDEFGHHAGDQIIIELAMILKSHVRHSDLVCRWGGEEFLVFLYNTELRDGIKLAENFRKMISESITSPSGEPITVSIGLAKAAQQDNLEEVLDKADRHLYFAKHTGRDRVCSQAHY